MAFTFNKIDDISPDLATKMATKSIFAPDQVLATANKIFESVPAPEKATATDGVSASAVVLKYFDSFAPSAANAPAPTSTEAPATTESEAPTAAESKAAAAAAKRMFSDGVARSKAAAISAVLTSKPRPADRFAAGTQITVKVSDKFKTAFAAYGDRLVPDTECPNNAANYAEMKKLIETGGTTPMYINEKARPTVAGYKISDKAASDGVVYVKKDKFALAGILVRDYATKIQEVAGVSDIGAYISKRTKDSKGRALVGKSSITVKMTGLSKYFADNANGVPIYVIDDKAEKIEVSAKSELSVQVYAEVNGVVDKTKKKTVRLSGRVICAPIAQQPDLDSAITMAGIMVKAPRGEAKTPDFTDSDKEIMATALAALGHGQENDTGIGSDLYTILTTPAPTAGNGDGLQ